MALAVFKNTGDLYLAIFLQILQNYLLKKVLDLFKKHFAISKIFQILLVPLLTSIYKLLLKLLKTLLFNINLIALDWYCADTCPRLDRAIPITLRLLLDFYNINTHLLLIASSVFIIIIGVCCTCYYLYLCFIRWFGM